MRFVLSLILVMGIALAASTAQAHTWKFGWKDNGDGTLTIAGVSYHSYSSGSSLDDFGTSSSMSGITVNGTNFGFTPGSAVDLGGSAAAFNGLGWDGTNVPGSSSSHAKYATVTLTSAQLASVGINPGSNSVSLTAYSNNADWADFSGTANVSITVSNVPEPSSWLILAGLSATLGIGGWWRRRRQAKS